jgi:RNA polymerase sigma-70 factor (ECF subfamily)
MDDFESTYRKHLHAVFRYAVRCVRRRDIAEEITSEAFLALFRNWDTIDRSKLPAWLFTVARNRSMDYLRRTALEERHITALPDPPEAPEPALESWLFTSKTLKPIHRACLVLRYVYGMSREEISRQTGLNETQIKSCLQYARELLKKELGESHL